MNILILGSGAREHCIAWKIKKDNPNVNIYSMPYNYGISKIGTSLECDRTNPEIALNFAKQNNIDLVIVSTDNYLAEGYVNLFELNGIRAFGPRRGAAKIEYSKIFSKHFMVRNNVQTPSHTIFTQFSLLTRYITEKGPPIVLKASGLHYGKGVLIYEDKKDKETVLNWAHNIMCGSQFIPGDKLIVEDYINGNEISLMAFYDGKTILPMASAKDYKRLLDGNKGPNTGGMGAYSPNETFTKEVEEQCMKKIIIPTIEGLKAENIDYKGIIYFGIIKSKDDDDVYLLEYNARFGDPEAQVVLPRLKNNILTVLDAVIDQKLDTIKLEWEDFNTCAIVMASGDYPEKGRHGTEMFCDLDRDLIFVSRIKKVFKKLLTMGGRICTVVGTGKDLNEARINAYEITKRTLYEERVFRTDIGNLN